jgi:NAD(P)-dependent dehydrogenase (short-subunit alcohol dehydrogenase family)
VTLFDTLFGLNSRTAIVTGASAGLGARFAVVLREAGARVVVAARRAAALEQRFGDADGFLPVACDVTRATDRERLIAAAVREFGSVDILVNNAGGANAAMGSADPLDAFAGVVDLNLTSAFALSLLAGQYMIDQGGGSIINVASMLGIVAATPANENGYVASKAGLIGLTKQMGTYWARKGVRVNALAPGSSRRKEPTRSSTTRPGPS